MEKGRVADLEARLENVERRLAALEDASRDIVDYEPEETGPVLAEGFASNASLHLGRVLLIFGGAYLLRAITDSQFVATGLGISLGAAYAVFWLYLAFRKAHDEKQRASAVFYGASSALLALPLLAEAVSKFELLSGLQGIVALAVFVALGLAVAAIRDLRSIGWLVTVGALVTAAAMLMATRVAVPATALIIVLGLAVLWLVYLREWKGMQWLAAIAANVSVITLAVLARSDQWAISAGTATLFGVVLLMTYLLSFVMRIYIGRHAPGIFEATQSLLVIAVSVVVASVEPELGERALDWLGWLALLLAGLAYAAAFSAKYRAARGSGFYYFSTLGLVLAIVGTILILPAVQAALLWSIMAVAVAWLSGRLGWVSLSLQCTVLIFGAGIASGILAAGLESLAGDVTVAWTQANVWHLGIALSTVACLFIPVAQHSDRWGRAAGLPQLTVLALSVW